MSRRSGRRQRDTNVIATGPSVLTSMVQPDVSPWLKEEIRREADNLNRKNWHPEGENRPIRTKSGRVAQVTLKTPNNRAFKIYSVGTKAIRAFSRPDSVLLCVRRKIRRQVMFALDLRKQGGAGGKRKIKWHSRIKC